MKNIILVMSLFISLNIFADYYQGYNVGFKGGLNLNNVTLINKKPETLEKEEYKFQKHFFIGGILKFNFVYNLSLQIEANFNNKGLYQNAKDIMDEYIYLRNTTQTFYYFEIPLILSFNVWNNLNVYGGFFYASLLNHNSHSEQSINGGEYSENDTDELYDYLNKSSYGYLFGINYVYKRFLIDFRFTKTTTELIPDDVRYDMDMVTKDDPTYRMDKLYQFQFGIGMLF